MFESDHKLRHLPFFEAIASADEGTPVWRSATAGLVTLRLVDAWFDEGNIAATDDGWSILSVRSAIEEVYEGSTTRTLLGRVIDALQSQKPDIHVVATPLMAYAQALEYDAQWALAGDVYQTILAHLHPTQDSDASIAAQLRLGFCYKNLNMLEDATTAFMAASEIANSVGDLVGVLRAEIGDAQIAVVRGNLARAEQILDETITRAIGANLSDVRSRALHDRSSVAQYRGQYELAIKLAYDALQHVQSATERDRILGGIAGAFAELGVYSAARDAYLVLSATAQEQFVRWASTINLMEIAWRTGMEPHFESYRRELATYSMPPHLATAYELTAGSGFQRFGNLGKARVHLQYALHLATEHGFNQFLFVAEEALLQLEMPLPPQKTPSSLSLDVTEVAQAIRGLRETVGA